MSSAEEPEGTGRGPRLTRALEPLDPGRIVDVAVGLTAELGLAGWPLRSLADAVGCWPTAITHHLGDREAVELAVVDRVVAMIPEPAGDLGWREWFGALLAALRPVLRGHPGVAGWLALSGPVVPSAQRWIDEGVTRLEAAGLRDEAAVAYTVMLNSAVQLIAVEDDRDARPGLREAMRRQLAAPRVDGAGMAAMAAAFAGEWDNDRVYAYGVDRLLDGVAARVEAKRIG